MATLSVTSSLQSKVECAILKDVQRPKIDIQLGVGAYGRVFEVQYLGKACAAKEVHSIFLRAAAPEEIDRIKHNFFRECRIWSALHHPNIVTLIGVYAGGDNDNTAGIPVMVMEKMECSLRSLIEQQEDHKLYLPLKVSILDDISVGLWHLHNQSPPIIHRDLTPNNILLRKMNQCYEAKISDLGVSKMMENTDSGRKMTKAPGTLDFMPPETRYDNPNYGTAVDIFSFAGIILYTIVQKWPLPTAREEINPANDKVEIVCEAQRRQEYLNLMTGFENDLKPLVISCLNDNPNCRPVISEVSMAIKEVKETTSASGRFDPLAVQCESSHLQVSLT